MDCPHCRAEVTTTPHTFALGIDQDGTWQVSSVRCATCDRLIVSVGTKEGKNYPAWPCSPAWTRLGADVPEDIAAEYLVANQVLPYSEEASAALSRRLLHRVLALQTGVGDGGLAEQVDRALLSPAVPPYLKEALETLVRVAALEPGSTKNQRPDALTTVEEGEAEWLLDVIQHLLDFYFVQPARMRRKRYALEERLAPAAPAAEPEDEQAPDTGRASAPERAATEGAADES